MTWRSRLTLPLASLAVAVGATAPAHASLMEFTGLGAGSPAGISGGPGTTVWFTQQGTPGGLGSMTAAGSLTEFTAGLTAGSDPADVVAGPDGAVWFTEPGATDAIGRLDPATGAVTEYTAGLTPGSDPTAIAAGPDGNLWFTQPSKPGIGRITPAGTITEFDAGPSGGAPSDITAGPDGNLWFTTTGPDRVARLQPGTGTVTEFSEGLAPSGAPAGITAAASGKLFFTEPGAGRVSRVKTDGKLESYSSGLAAGAQPTAIAEGGDGAIWFTDADEPGRIGRLWPASGEIQELTGGLAAGLSARRRAGRDRRGPGRERLVHPARPAPAHRPRDRPAAGRRLDARARRRPCPARRPRATQQPGDHVLLRLRPDHGLRLEHRDGGGRRRRGPRQAHGRRRPGPRRALPRARDGGERLGHRHLGGQALLPRGRRIDPQGEAGQGGQGRPHLDRRVVAPAPVVPDSGTEVLPPAAPVLGQTVGLAPVSGAVRIKVPGARTFVPLAAGAAVKVGSVVDTRRGTVELKSALASGRVQKGKFWGSLFEVRQPRSARGRTDLVLRGGRFDRCPSGGRKARASGVTRDVGRTTVVRRLWGRDRHGRFRTRGRDSVAAVRGTVWSTADRCDGTMTRVKQGAVLVRNRHTGRRVLVTAGHRHLARHPR